jgi:hypothetical protein
LLKAMRFEDFWLNTCHGIGSYLKYKESRGAKSGLSEVYVLIIFFV